MNSSQRRKVVRRYQRLQGDMRCRECFGAGYVSDAFAISCEEVICSTCGGTGSDGQPLVTWHDARMLLAVDRECASDTRRNELWLRRSKQCARCGGHGMEPVAPDWSCGTCGGEGRMPC